jgi:hypothetical protein
LRHENGPQAATPGGHHRTTQPTDQEAESAVTVAPPADIPAFLALSDERDLWQKLAEAREKDAYKGGWRDGYELGEADGYVQAIAQLKVAQHDDVRHLRQHLVTWDGLRTKFAEDRPGDFPGVAA